MINYNIVLYIGLALIVGGFCLFLYSQMRLRQLDREQFKNNQLTKSFNKAKNDWFSIYTCGHSNNTLGLFKLSKIINLSRDPID